MLITNAAPDAYDVVERATEAGAVTENTRPLALAFRPASSSRSHVALPCRMSDSLYGMQPDKTEELFGVHLGAIAPRGERGVPIPNLDALLRMSSNPFFPYLLGRIEQCIAEPRRPAYR